MSWVRWILLMFGVVLATPAQAAVLQVEATARELPLWPHLEVFEDPQAGLTIADVTRPEVAAQFAPYKGKFAPNFGITESAVWVRLTLLNPTSAPLERWLEVDQSTLDDVRLYEPGAPVRRQGRTLPLNTQELRRPTYDFRLTLPPGSQRVVHLRCESENEMQVALTLWEVGALSEHDIHRSLSLALAYGILLAMVLYNLFIFIFVRDRAHLFYALYVLCFAAWLSLLDGTLPMLVPRTIGVFPRWPFMVSGVAAFSFSALFARDLLELRATRPRLDKAVLALPIGFSVWVAIGLTLVSWRVANRVSSSLIPVEMCVLLTAGILRWRDGLVAARYYTLAFAALFAFLLTAALALLGLLPFQGPGLLIHVGAVVEAVLLSLALAEGTRRRNNQIARLHQAGRRFVPFEFLALLHRPELPDVQVGDQVERHMTVFFADLRGFTQLSETLTPAETIALVNRYLQAMEPPIRAHGGFVDKYIGDAVMALFETPASAVQAALDCLAAIEQLNASRPGLPPLQVGIGLHAGPLVLGTVGSQERLACTVIGDSVNLASRVESLTKRYQVPLLLTGAVAEGLEPGVALREIDEVAVKGKSASVRLSEVLAALPAGARALRQELAAAFQDGRALLARGEFAKAAAALELVSGRDSSDEAARLHFETARNLADRGTPNGWDGITRLEKK